ncbi:unnamed protein product [Rotaria sp. Silwood2]|nr:unnamed protein product [Rotaria sp. Silwood2]CAF4114890.1 unnamed protein product [Rotaria sp. Silwood2]
MAHSNNSTMADADSLSQIYDISTISSTDNGREAMDRSCSDCDPPVQIASTRSHQTLTESAQVEQLFNNSPSGYTPLTRTLREALRLPAARRGYDKKLLVFIATDGEPSGDNGNPDLPEFKRVMSQERSSDTTHVMFLICTDESTTVDYLMEWDRTMNNVDVTDTFEKERQKIRLHHSGHQPFSKANWIVKILIGTIDQQTDLIND